MREVPFQIGSTDRGPLARVFNQSFLEFLLTFPETEAHIDFLTAPKSVSPKYVIITY